MLCKGTGKKEQLRIAVMIVLNAADTNFDITVWTCRAAAAAKYSPQMRRIKRDFATALMTAYDTRDEYGR
jgi:hypothetical protein